METQLRTPELPLETVRVLEVTMRDGNIPQGPHRTRRQLLCVLEVTMRDGNTGNPSNLSATIMLVLEVTMRDGNINKKQLVFNQFF